MFPVHGYVNPYCQTFPHHSEPNSYPRHYYYPGWEVMPQMKADPFKHQSVFVPSSSPSLFSENMCCPNSGWFHHSSPGHYNFSPQFSHVQPSSQVYHYGPFSPYNGAYPAYFVFPPHYSVDQPRYDYDKAQNHCCGCTNHTCHNGAYPDYFVFPPHYSVDQPRYDYDKAQNHCCGCTNHTCHQRDDSSPKIEEQKPENGQQAGDSSGLIRLPNCPSPVVWVPASTTKDREGDKASQLQPGCWNGWMPLDDNSPKGSRQEDEGKKGQQDEDKWSQKWSPFPIFWMPGHEKAEKPVKDLKEITPKSVEDWPSKFKIVPLRLLENENDGARSKSVQEEQENQLQPEAPGEKERKTKTIPVMQMEERCQKKASIPEKQEEKLEEKKATSFEKPKEESEVNKASDKKRSSPVRSSKLSPVCLRVDPLPRKKTNGASPSPPGHKDRDHQHNEGQSSWRENGEEISEKVIPVISVNDNTSIEPDKEQKCQGRVSVASPEDLMEKSVAEVPDSVRKTAGLDNCLKAEEVTEGSKIGEKDSEERMSTEAGTKEKMGVDKGHAESLESKEVKETKGTKRNLSQTDAAIIIQSAYRGLEVRRWHPLEKLQKIAKVREQAGNIRRQVQSIEASSMALDAKQRIVIGETIMTLLLELDTIQGLHPSVREIRKSVARELVCLQEKLDSFLGSQAAEEHESVKVEEKKGATDDGASLAGSVADQQQSFKWESLEDKIDSIGNAAIKDAELDVNLVELPSNDEIAVVASPSFSGEPDSKEFEQPAEGNSGENKPSSENKSERPDIETAIVASPSQASEPASDQGPNLIVGTDLLSGLVRPADENSASENPFSEGRKSDTNQEILGDMTRGERALTESDGSANVPLLVGNGPCEKDESQSSSVLVCTDEKASMMSPGDAVPGLDVKDLLEPLQEIEHKENEGAPVDHGAEDDAIVDIKLEDPPVQHVEEQFNPGEVRLLTGEGERLALDAGESVVCMAEYDRSEPKVKSCLEQECGQNAHEDLPMLPVRDDSDLTDTSLRVEGDDRKDVSCRKHAMEVDGLKQVTSENFEVLATEDGSCTAGVAQGNNEKGLNVIVDEVDGLSGDVLCPADKDASIEAGHAPVVRPEMHAFVLNKEPAESRGRARGRSGNGAEDPDQKADSQALQRTSGDMNKEEMKLLEENEKLREMLEKLLEAGKEQLGVISNLNGRVKDLERKLAQKKRKVKHNKPGKIHS